MRIAAPGKLMLAGEYAVLEGHPCLVAAVDRYVVAETTDELVLEPAEAMHTRQVAEQRFGRALAPLDYEATALREGGKKLGLGSSSAIAVAAAAFAVASANNDQLADGHLALVFELAREGHGKVSAGGSGADVAASVFGGVLEYSIKGRATPVATQGSVPMRIVWTGVESRTHTLLPRIRAFKVGSRHEYAQTIAELSDAANEMCRAWRSSSVVALRDAVHAHHEALAQLGARANAPIVESHLRRIADIARNHRGAAKPSGAGGGDIAVAFFVSNEDAASFEHEVVSAGYPVIQASVGARGVHLR